MCLAIPSEIAEIRDQTAIIDLAGVRREVSLLLLPEEASVGEWVLVHAGFAIQKIDKEAAEETLKLLEEIAKSEEGSRHLSKAEPSIGAAKIIHRTPKK